MKESLRRIWRSGAADGERVSVAIMTNDGAEVPIETEESGRFSRARAVETVKALGGKSAVSEVIITGDTDSDATAAAVCICYDEISRSVTVNERLSAEFWLEWIAARHFTEEGRKLKEGARASLLDDVETIREKAPSQVRGAFTGYLESLDFFKEADISPADVEAHARRREEEDAEKSAQGIARRIAGGFLDDLSEGKITFSQYKTEINSALEKIERERLSHTAPAPLTWEDRRDKFRLAPPKLQTGFEPIPSLIPGAITLIAGRPSHGKTATMLNLIRSAALTNSKKQFLYFTFEETATPLYFKILCALAGKDLTEYLSAFQIGVDGSLDVLEIYERDPDALSFKDRAGFEKVYNQASETMRELHDSGRIRILPGSEFERAPSVEELPAIVQRCAEESKLEIGGVFVDYVQRMRSDVPNMQVRETVNAASQALLKVALGHNVPVVSGAQFNRSAGDQKRPPALSDLKESGNLEEDANTVYRVWNLSQEYQEKGREEGSEEMPSAKLEKEPAIMEIRALKARDGRKLRSLALFSNRFWHIEGQPGPLGSIGDAKEARRWADAEGRFTKIWDALRKTDRKGK